MFPSGCAVESLKLKCFRNARWVLLIREKFHRLSKAEITEKLYNWPVIKSRRSAFIICTCYLRAAWLIRLYYIQLRMRLTYNLHRNNWSSRTIAYFFCVNSGERWRKANSIPHSNCTWVSIDNSTQCQLIPYQSSNPN